MGGIAAEFPVVGREVGIEERLEGPSLRRGVDGQGVSVGEEWVGFGEAVEAGEVVAGFGGGIWGWDVDGAGPSAGGLGDGLTG